MTASKTLFGVMALILILSGSCSTSIAMSPIPQQENLLSSPQRPGISGSSTIEWDLQANVTGAYFKSISMCKGTTEQTRKAGFIGSALGSIWRTLDGVSWKQVKQFPSSTNWFGIHCFPDAQRVIAVGCSDADAVLENGAIITWSFDGGDTWTDRLPMPDAQPAPWLKSVHFYNNTHGITLPFLQYKSYLAFYTTNGGKTAADWNVVRPADKISWYWGNPIWAFGGVTKTLASDFNKGPQLCTSDDAGQTWPPCEKLVQPVIVGSFVTPNDAVGVDSRLNVYSTRNGGTQWRTVSSVPKDLTKKVVSPASLAWIPNSDVVVLVGGVTPNPVYEGSLVHSLDRGTTWIESMPGLAPTYFTAIDSVAISNTTTELWTVGISEESAVILHATVTTA